MFSTMTAVPSATVSSAISWACMSVAKPGYSCVRAPTARGRPCMAPRIQSGPVSMVRPASTSLSSVAPMVSGAAPRSVMSPPAAPTAHRKVPASMRSAMTSWRAPCSRATPSTTMRSVPWPWMRAPILMSSSARSTTSGSRAAFSSTVWPSASTAAISRFSVPVTVTMSVRIEAPFRRVARATTKPCSISISAPSAASPLMCWSTGRWPIAQPPGRLTRAWPKRASSGPSTRIEARMVLTSSYGASRLSTWSACRVTVPSPARSARTPMRPSRRSVVEVSFSCGTLPSTSGSAVSRLAHRMGRAAFLAPETVTSPRRGEPPVMRSLSISFLPWRTRRGSACASTAHGSPPSCDRPARRRPAGGARSGACPRRRR
ncbi:Uncharacterised protein [Bordetella pertussis]|nr:Uncharacterised protein [Bordetella pertussis]